MRLLIILLCSILSFGLRAQSNDMEVATLESRLCEEGMEMIRCVRSDTMIYVSFEDRVDKQPWLGLVSLIRICAEEQISCPVSANLLLDGIPRINLLFREQEIIRVSAATYECQSILSEIPATEKPFGKLSITAFPVIMLNNSRTDVIFRIFGGIAPTLGMQLWKGADLTAQIIIPIYNSLENQFDYVRPGIIALTQRFKIGNRWLLIGSVGNFTNQRAGANACIHYDLPSGRWGIAVKGGVTGSSTTWNGDWSFSRWRKVDAHLSTYYYFPGSNTKIEAEAGRYVMGDYGVRGNVSRRFRNVTVSLYGMISGGEFNGGFSFIVPLAFTRLKKMHPVNFVWPKWYDWEYTAQSGPEYTKKGLDISYRSRLYERADDSYWNPAYIKSQIIHILNTK